MPNVSERRERRHPLDGARHATGATSTFLRLAREGRAPHPTAPGLFPDGRRHSQAHVDDSISITLNRAQVAHVLRQAGQEAGIAATLSGLADNRKLAQAYASIRETPELSRSLLIGLLVLRCFPEDGASLGVKDIADTIGTKPSNAFRYMATLLAAGLLERDPRTRRYRLAGRQPVSSAGDEDGPRVGLAPGGRS